MSSKNTAGYIQKIQANPQYRTKELLKKEKMNILKNYNIYGDNDSHYNDDTPFFGNFAVPEKVVPQTKSNIEKKPIQKYSSYGGVQKTTSKPTAGPPLKVDDISDEVYHDNEIEEDKFEDYIESQLNDDLSGLKDKFHCDDIEEEIKNNYIEESKEPKKNVEKPKKKLDRPATAVAKKPKPKEVIEVLEPKQKKEPKPEIIKESKPENIYEKIFKQMQKGKQSELNSNAQSIQKSKEASLLNSNAQSIQKSKEASLLKSIDKNPLDDPSLIIKKGDEKIDDIRLSASIKKEPIGTEKGNPKEFVETFRDNLIQSQQKEITNSIEKEKEISEKPNEVTDNVLMTSQKDNKSVRSSMSQSVKKKQNDIYDRLNSFLDQSTTQNIPPKKVESPQPGKELTSYISDAQIQADNIGLNLELKEAKKTIETMTSVISELKSQLKAKDDYLNKALLSQKNESDLALNRQNTLMESLYSEKKKMEAQISELQDKLSQSEKSSYKKLQTMRENYELETKKNKDAWFQAEKLRRKKWEEQKVKEIKDLTAKGLEPEIEKIISNHKQEISEIEDHYLKEIKKQKETLVEDFDEKLADMKKKLTKEKDDAIEHEKNLTVQRLRNQSERFEDEINEERRRWNSKMQSEISRLESLREKDKKIYEEQISKLEERNNNNIFSNENFYQSKLDNIKKDYDQKLQNEIAEMKMNLEKENEKVLDQRRNEIEKKFKEMKLEYLKDRDKQINTVIQKLGEETLNERKKNLEECEKKANEKNLHLIEENNQLKNKLADVAEKLQAETKNRVNLEENILLLNTKIKEKERELQKTEKKLSEVSNGYNEMTDKLSGLTRDFNKEKMNLEIEMKSHLQKGDAEIALLNNKLKTAQKILEKQKEDLENLHRKEIEEIEKKIKKSFQRKDEIIQKLQEEIDLKEVTIQKYEEMINQQRKELFGKMK